MKHILLLPNAYRDASYRVTLSAAEILYQNGAVLYAEDCHTALDGVCGIRLFPKEDFPKEIECAVVFGGDGSILDASALALTHHIPLLGVNMGHLGYLAGLEKDGISLLKKLLSNAFVIREIQVYAVTVGNKTLERYAVNEVTISRGNCFRIADMELSVDGGSITYRADGLIVATPTGSTAYSLSAGGAVIDPSLDLLSVTPICPHSFFSRTIIFSGETTVSVKNKSQTGEPLLVTVDGRKGAKLSQNESVTVRRAEESLQLIQLCERPFIQVLKEKMSL